MKLQMSYLEYKLQIDTAELELIVGTSASYLDDLEDVSLINNVTELPDLHILKKSWAMRKN